MKIIHYEPETLAEVPKALLSLTAEDTFLDIETTGLSPKYHPIYLIGLGKYNPKENILTLLQLFAETEAEEPDILREFLKLLPTFSSIITFNGNRFDLPYLRQRLKKWNMDSSLLEQIVKKDLYLDFKPAKKMFQLPSLRQKSVEAFLGIRRTDEMNGGELISVYKEYESDRDADKEHLLLLHNADDVRGMIPLFRMYDFLQVDRFSLSLDRISSEGGRILFWGSTDLPFPSDVRYREDHLLLSISGGSIRGAVSPEEGVLSFQLPDPENYVYLTVEQKILPKILAASIPRERYRKARKADCVQKASGQFLPSLWNASDLKSSGQRAYFHPDRPKKLYVKVDTENNEKRLIPFLENYLTEYLRQQFSKR